MNVMELMEQMNSENCVAPNTSESATSPGHTRPLVSPQVRHCVVVSVL